MVEVDASGVLLLSETAILCALFLYCASVVLLWQLVSSVNVESQKCQKV